MNRPPHPGRRNAGSDPTAGFTLVELAIVLVVVGLLAGGVLVGRDLVHGAEIRATISQVEKYQTAFKTFKLKFNCIPGDCPNASDYGLGTNGNGNGQIYSECFMAAGGRGGAMKESLNAWYQLHQAGLVDGIDKGYDGFASFAGDFTAYEPPLKVRTKTFLAAVTVTDTSLGDLYFGNAFLLHGQSASNIGYQNALTAPEAFAIDAKLDDGLPDSGAVMMDYAYSGPRVRVGGGMNGCTLPSGGSSAYDLKGVWQSYATQIRNTPPNPDQVGCEIAITNMF